MHRTGPARVIQPRVTQTSAAPRERAVRSPCPAPGAPGDLRASTARTDRVRSSPAPSSPSRVPASARDARDAGTDSRRPRPGTSGSRLSFYDADVNAREKQPVRASAAGPARRPNARPESSSRVERPVSRDSAERRPEHAWGEDRVEQKVPETPTRRPDEPPRFRVIEYLCANEHTLFNLLDGLKAGATHSSFFCREYFGTAASEAQALIERLHCTERLKRQIHQACILETLALGLASQLCSGTMDSCSTTIRSRLKNLLYYIHENTLIMLDLVSQRWLTESEQKGDRFPNINIDIIFLSKRYRRLRSGEHILALRQQNEMIQNVLRHLCRPTSKRASVPRTGRGREENGSKHRDVMSLVGEYLSSRTLDRTKSSLVRQRVMQFMRFRPLLADGAAKDSPWPTHDAYERYGVDRMGTEGALLYFEPLPPMLPHLHTTPLLPPLATKEIYTLVLDLDETLAHYIEADGMGYLGPRPGAHDFLQRMNGYGYEIVIFTAATQDYADWVINQLDTEMRVHHRLYRQHALPWGPVFVKDLSRLGRDMERTLIIDNVQENYMFQPENGIFICPWYDDPKDTALFALTPLLEEIVTTRASVPQMLARYKDQIPSWAGFDNYDPAEWQFQFGEEDEAPQPLTGAYQQPRQQRTNAGRSAPSARAR